MPTQMKKSIDEKQNCSEEKSPEVTKQSSSEQDSPQESQNQPLSEEQLFLGGLIPSFTEEELDFLEDMGYL